MQIMFSLTPNSTQDPPGTLWEDISCLFLIWSVGCYECHQKTILVHVHIPFRLSSKHHESRNFPSSQVVIHFEMFIVVPSTSQHDTTHLAAQNSSELDNTDMVNYLKCCKWKVSSILWCNNHQHQQKPLEK
jgi:hypothetical protein